MARAPKAGHVMGVVTHLLGAVFMALVLTGSIPFFLDAWQKDWYIGVEGMFTAPVWPIALIIIVGVTVTMTQFLVMLADHCRRLAGRD